MSRLLRQRLNDSGEFTLQLLFGSWLAQLYWLWLSGPSSIACGWPTSS